MASSFKPDPLIKQQEAEVLALLLQQRPGSLTKPAYTMHQVAEQLGLPVSFVQNVAIKHAVASSRLNHYL